MNILRLRIIACIILLCPIALSAMNANNNNNNYGSINNNNNNQVTHTAPSKINECDKCALDCAECCCFPCYVCQAGYHKWDNLEVEHTIQKARKKSDTAQFNQAPSTQPSQSECDLGLGCTWLACCCCLAIQRCIHEQELSEAKHHVKMAETKNNYVKTMHEMGLVENTEALNALQNKMAPLYAGNFSYGDKLILHAIRPHFFVSKDHPRFKSIDGK